MLLKLNRYWTQELCSTEWRTHASRSASFCSLRLRSSGKLKSDTAALMKTHVFQHVTSCYVVYTFWRVVKPLSWRWSCLRLESWIFNSVIPWSRWEYKIFNSGIFRRYWFCMVKNEILHKFRKSLNYFFVCILINCLLDYKFEDKILQGSQ